MSRLIETLHASRYADSARRELGLAQVSDTESLAIGRPSQIRWLARHAAERIRPPHYRYPPSIQRRRTGIQQPRKPISRDMQPSARATDGQARRALQHQSHGAASLQAYSQLFSRISQSL